MKSGTSLSRRAFIKGMAVASAAVLCPGRLSLVSPCLARGGPEPSLGVHHEWGTLKEAIVGAPYVRFPVSMPLAIRRRIPPEWLALFDAHPGQTLASAAPGLYHRIHGQMEAVISVLRDRGVTVHRPAEMTPGELGYLAELFPACGAQLYPRDPLLVIGERALETELFFPFRRRERFGIRRALEGRFARAGVAVSAMPPALPVDGMGGWGQGPILEGGDVLLLGQDILVGLSGNASNAEGVRWLARCLGPGYRVHGVRLSQRFLHLDCCLSAPRPGLALICREAFMDGIPDCLKGWELMAVSLREALGAFACNGLILDETAMLLDGRLSSLAKRLRAAGQEVIEVPFDAVAFFGGSLRCWHQALVREGSL